jgi:hypothetical protein
MRGIIQINSPIVRDKLRLGVSDAVTDTALNPIDGDANGSAGGALNFRIDVIVGDASGDGSVNGGDLPFFSASFNRSAGQPQFNPRADWSSDGSVNGGDLPFFSGNFNQSLPSSEPGALPFGSPPMLASSSLLAPEIDSFFAFFDDDEELLDADEQSAYIEDQSSEEPLGESLYEDDIFA